jgi:hypothetical protein
VFVRNNILYTANGATTLNAVSGTVVQGNDYFAAGTTSPLIVYGGTSYNSLSALRLIGQEMVQGSPTGLNVDAGIVDVGGGGTISDADQLDTLVAYNLQFSSLMRDAGLNLNALFGIDMGTTDFYGVPVSQDGGFDIGASEFVPEPTCGCAAILAMATLSFRPRSRRGSALRKI